MTRKLTAEELANVLCHAEYGDRVVMDGKTVWAGLGNRSGLHSHANEAIREKWNKSHARFIKKMTNAEFDEIQLQVFRNINRDRGNWISAMRIK